MNRNRTLEIKINAYVIERDHSNKTQFFRVNVPEAGQRGIGFQVRFGPKVYGVSVTHVGEPRSGSHMKWEEE